jgi:hypothetical protein
MLIIVQAGVVTYGAGKYASFPRATSQADMLACPFGNCPDKTEMKEVRITWIY